MLVVIWIDWYAYHTARFRALAEHESLRGRVAGIEMVGGVGVHAGLQFRDSSRNSLPVETLLPQESWSEAGQWRLAAATWRSLSKLRPLTVLVPGYYTLPAIAAAVWGRLHRSRTVLMTESTREDHARSGWKEALKGLLIRILFDWAVAGGEAHVRYLRALGVPMNRIGRSYDVVDNEFYSENSEALRLRSEPSAFGLPSRYFLYVGRLAEEKNVSGLLNAFADYRKAGGSWHLVLVGDGPLRSSLEAEVDAHGISGVVHFPGLKSAAQLVPYYAFAGCFVLPSSREPWGLVVNEAMACGLPVLVSRRCGCAEDLVENGGNGWIFDPENSVELTGLLRRVAGMPEQNRLALGRVSTEIIGNYSPRTWASEVARIVAA